LQTGLQFKSQLVSWQVAAASPGQPFVFVQFLPVVFISMLQGIRQLLINQGQEEISLAKGYFVIHLLRGFLSIPAGLLVLALGRESLLE